jgi:uncharacterized protein
MFLPELTFSAALTLAGVGIAAGVCNAIAGGGTMFSFPVFLATGLPPVVANASNAVAVWPGHALAAVGYRQELRQSSIGLIGAGVAALSGGATGAYLLSLIGDGAFVNLIPFLLLFATVIFAVGPTANRWLAARTNRSSATPKNFGPLGYLGIFVFSIYGGIMLMAGLILLGVEEAQQNNAIKNFLSALVASVTVVILAVAGLVAWPQTLCGIAGAIVGGLLGTRFARLMPPILLRQIVIAVGGMLSAYYFIEFYA